MDSPSILQKKAIHDKNAVKYQNTVYFNIFYCETPKKI